MENSKFIKGISERNVPSIRVDYEGLVEGCVIVTQWNNGEGYDIYFGNNNGDERVITMHCDEYRAFRKAMKLMHKCDGI